MIAVGRLPVDAPIAATPARELPGTALPGLRSPRPRWLPGGNLNMRLGLATSIERAQPTAGESEPATGQLSLFDDGLRVHRPVCRARAWSR